MAAIEASTYLCRMPWNSKLREPVELVDGRVLTTLEDAGKLVLALPAHCQKRVCWEATATLLVKAAEGAGDRHGLLQLTLKQALTSEQMLKPRERLFKKRQKKH